MSATSHFPVRQDTSDDSRLRSGYIHVAAGTAAMALVFSVHYAFGVFFKPLSAEFGWTRAMTAGAFSLVWVMQGLLSIVMGGLTDRFGPRAVLSIGAVLIGGGYLLTSQTQTIWELYLFYGVLVGAGLGGTFVPLTSATARWFVKRRGVMTGFVTSGVGIGALVGPIVANWLISNYNWRRSYLVLGAVVLVGVLIAAQFLRRPPTIRSHPEAAENQTASMPQPIAHGLTLVESVCTSQFWIVSVVFFCYGYTWTAILLHLAPHATDVGLSAASAARMVAVIGGASILGKVLMGMAADHIGNKMVYVVSFALMILSLLWLSLLTGEGSFYLFAFIFGFAYGGLATAHSPLVAWLFGIRKHGLIFGVCFNSWTLGCAVGPIIAGHIFDVTHSYKLAFLICSAACTLGLLMTLPLKPAYIDPLAASTPTLLKEKTI
jgi:MFS family permease